MWMDKERRQWELIEGKQVRRDIKPAWWTWLHSVNQQQSLPFFPIGLCFIQKKVTLLKHAVDKLKQYSLRSSGAPPMSKQCSAGQVCANKSETANSTSGSKNGGFTDRVWWLPAGYERGKYRVCMCVVCICNKNFDLCRDHQQLFCLTLDDFWLKLTFFSSFNTLQLWASFNQ